ncbi:MAG: DUF4388 domain-containing protein [Myxococcaceae bacterium]
MAQARRILIADPDLSVVKPLTRFLRQRGFQVDCAQDGARALEMAVLRHPDIVLFDEACRLLDVRTFGQILRSNPRTDDIPVVTMSEGEPAGRDGVLRKPFNLDEVMGHLEHVLRRSAAAQKLRAETKDIEGTLSQLSIVDLVQILGLNRRTGRLELTRADEKGEVHMSEGRIVHARAGLVEGEKALFRLLGWTEGAFAFVPTAVTHRGRGGRDVDEILLEGARQVDEAARFLSMLPTRQSRLELAPEASGADALHPVTARVMELLHTPRLMSEVLDLAPAPDLEVLSALKTLLDRGMVRLAPQLPDVEGPPPLLSLPEVHALRTRIFRARASGDVAVAKIIVCGHSAAAARILLSELPTIQPVSAESLALKNTFGLLAKLQVAETLEIHFFVLPTSDAARPLWRPFCSGALGGFVFDTSEATLKLGRFVAFDLRAPVVVMGEQVPPALQGAPAWVDAFAGPVPEAVRALLVRPVVSA